MDTKGRINVGRLTKPKIVATLGPASNSEANLRKLIAAGMDVARLNFSHGTHEEKRETFELLQQLSAENEHQIAILCDIQGPKIRTGDMEAPFELDVGDSVRVTQEPCLGTKKRFQIRYPGTLLTDLSIGDKIFVNDGIVRLNIESQDGQDFVCSVEAPGPISSKKGCNLPSGNLSVTFPTEKDARDLEFICKELRPDYIAVSFVGKAEDMHAIRNFCKKHGFEDVKLCSKIERPSALENLTAITEASDIVMVARGDLGVEIPLHQVPVWQNRIIETCADFATPVIVATQMLESMIEQSRPTRAEVSDVFTAVQQGADAVMLSGETSVGRFPIVAVNTMDTICKEAETKVVRNRLPERFPRGGLVPLAAAGAAGIVRAITAQNMSCNVMCISRDGTTASWLSSLRLPVNVFAFSDDPATIRSCSLMWGVRGILLPFVLPDAGRQELRGSLSMVGQSDTETNFIAAIRRAHEMDLLSVDDTVLMIASSLLLGTEGGIHVSIFSVAKALEQ